jgi:uncharacterized protein YqeY
MIQTQIKERIITAMKERTDEGKLLASVLKNIKGKLENEAKVKKVEILDDKDAEKIIQKYVKERKDSLDVANQADRPDLAEKEQFEIDTFSEYLPQVMSEEETRKIVQDLINDGASNIGQIMGKLSQYGNTIDKGLASKLARELG